MRGLYTERRRVWRDHVRGAVLRKTIVGTTPV